jgi:hypothetical protein
MTTTQEQNKAENYVPTDTVYRLYAVFLRGKKIRKILLLQDRKQLRRFPGRIFGSHIYFKNSTRKTVFSIALMKPWYTTAAAAPSHYFLSATPFCRSLEDARWCYFALMTYSQLISSGQST